MSTAQDNLIASSETPFDIDLPFTSYSPSHPLHLSAKPSEVITGFWYIVGSSLPLWKPKKNVVIRYTPNQSAKEGEVKFDDEIRSDSRSKKVENKFGKDLAAKWTAEQGFMDKYLGIKGTNVLQKDYQNG